METMRFAACGPRVTQGDLDQLSARLGLPLPTTYSSFLLRTNGGIPSRATFRITGHPDGTDCLSCFFGLHHSDAYMRLEHAIENLPAYVRGGLLPIGMALSASLLALDLSHSPSDRVYYLDVADPLDEHEMKRAYFVSEDVDAFLLALEE